MPNIYLRLPVSRCQFFRHRDPAHVLGVDEPLVFNMYMPEHYVIRQSLTNVPSVGGQVNLRCFSQQQWQRMMEGRHPVTDRLVVKRNDHEYLTFEEVQTIIGRMDYNKSAKEDYLCIHLPREVMVGETAKMVTHSWTLDTFGIRQLSVLLNNEFKRCVVEWALSTFDFCTERGRVICRTQSAMLERFLMRYGIDTSIQEKDYLRRVIDRWLRAEHANFSAYSCFDMQYHDDREEIHHVDHVRWV